MRKSTAFSAGLFLLLAMLYSGCGCGEAPDGQEDVLNPDEGALPGGGTETGNPAGGDLVVLSFLSSELLASPDALVLKQEVSDQVPVVTTALAVVRAVAIEEAVNCPDLALPTEASVFDLLAINSRERYPEDGGHLHESCQPAATFTLGPLTEGDVFAATELGQRMIGKSLLIRVEGIRQDPIEFRAFQEWTLQFPRASDWIDPSAGENLILAFDREGWFSGIDLTNPAFPLRVEGEEALFVVEEEEFPEILDLLVFNQNRSSGLYPDRNGNRQLDLEEYLTPIVLFP